MADQNKICMVCIFQKKFFKTTPANEDEMETDA